MNLNNFLHKYFPGVELISGLFYQWPIALRFELGLDYSAEQAYKGSPYLSNVYQRAITLYHALNEPNDDLLIVTDAVDEKTWKRKPKSHKHRNLFAPYVREGKYLKQLQLAKVNYPEEEETYSRFILPVKSKEIRIEKWLEAICNSDMGILPQYRPPICFINLTKQTIFYVYDDQGCDVLAVERETIEFHYQKYNDWLLDYDRKEMDAQFHHVSL